MKVVTVLGARPQFIKAAPVSRAFQAAGIDEFLLHTGQHYDTRLSELFFDELGLPEPHANLGIGSGSHGWQTGQMLIGIEAILKTEAPDWVLVYGDTNSTLAGALAAAKLQFRLAHVEAGLRSYNRNMPEEHNRVLTDALSDLLFCPTQTAVANLEREGFSSRLVVENSALASTTPEGFVEHSRSTPVGGRICLVGDVMYDAALLFSGLPLPAASQVAHHLPGDYILATLHRPANTDNPERLEAILEGLRQLDLAVVLPIHPRTRQKLNELGWMDRYLNDAKLHIIPPAGYLEMLHLEKNARWIITDSGGVQKEAYFFGTPCLTIRTETEWPETLQDGWNRLVEARSAAILEAVQRTIRPTQARQPFFGDGQAARRIAHILLHEYERYPVA
ncbi:MAG: UDP-N-acetyl glucosamine 2-epimerase [Anaerolineales bacterium]|jgi:UDP-N-acetylglucosamine 2-epimerase|nr:UDP-N-acetyl glucosamine 2-epimerase [Anaerolineales bacterium]